MSLAKVFLETFFRNSTFNDLQLTISRRAPISKHSKNRIQNRVQKVKIFDSSNDNEIVNLKNRKFAKNVLKKLLHKNFNIQAKNNNSHKQNFYIGFKKYFIKSKTRNFGEKIVHHQKFHVIFPFFLILTSDDLK